MINKNKLMKKFVLVIITVLCFCILCLNGCADKNHFTFSATVLCDGEPVGHVQAFINGLATNKITDNEGKIVVDNLNYGDELTFYKEGYTILISYKITSSIDTTFEIFRDNLIEFPPVNVSFSPDIVTDYNVIDSDNGDFCIDFVLPPKYMFGGYFINDLLISKDINYNFNVSLRGDIEVRLYPLYDMVIKDFDDTAILYSGEFPIGEEINLGKLIDDKELFEGWYIGGELLSNDIDYIYTTTEVNIIYLKRQVPRLNAEFNGRKITVDTNLTFDLYVDDEVVDTNLCGDIWIGDYIHIAGEYNVKLVNNKYDLVVEHTVKMVNNNTPFEPKIFMYEGKYYIAFYNYKYTNSYKIRFEIGLKEYEYYIAVKDSEYFAYADITNYIHNGYNEIRLVAEDRDKILSSESLGAVYIKYHYVDKPNVVINDNILKVTNNKGYECYLCINGVIADRIIDDEIDISHCRGTDKVQVLYKGEYIYPTLSDDIDLAMHLNEDKKFFNSDNFNMFVNIIDDVLYINWQNDINCISTYIAVNERRFKIPNDINCYEISEYLHPNQTNTITIEKHFDNEIVKTDTIEYFYEKLGVINIHNDKNMLYYDNIYDYYTIRLNGVIIEEKYTKDFVDLYDYLLDIDTICVEVEGYVNDIKVAYSKYDCDYQIKHILPFNNCVIRCKEGAFIYFDYLAGIDYKIEINSVVYDMKSGYIYLKDFETGSKINLIVTLSNGYQITYKIS